MCGGLFLEALSAPSSAMHLSLCLTCCAVLSNPAGEPGGGVAPQLLVRLWAGSGIRLEHSSFSRKDSLRDPCKRMPGFSPWGVWLPVPGSRRPQGSHYLQVTPILPSFPGEILQCRAVVGSRRGQDGGGTSCHLKLEPHALSGS